MIYINGNRVYTKCKFRNNSEPIPSQSFKPPEEQLIPG